MKITDSEIIKSGEKELLDAITADLDWGAIEKIFIKNHGLEIEEDIEYQKGDIVSYQDQIAYQLEFSVKVGLSVLLDREGNYLSVAISGQQDRAEVSDEEAVESASDNNIEEQTDSDKKDSLRIENTKEDEPLEESKDNYLEALTELDSADIPNGSEMIVEQAFDKGADNTISDQDPLIEAINENPGDAIEHPAMKD